MLCVAHNVAMDSQQQQVLPKSIGGYEIGARIGDGAMHVAKCQGAHRKLACKVIPRERQGDFMLNDARAISRLNSVAHPNIARVLDVAQDDEGTLLVIEGLGTDLHTLLREVGRLQEDYARRIFAQIAAAVERCHAVNVVIRDLKLSKLYTSSSSRHIVKLADLERACVLDRPDQPLVEAHGSPAYVAPEMLTRAPYSGQAADLWGLGVILYTMLAGHYPFADATPRGLFAKIKSGAFEMPPWVSPAAASLVMRLLSCDPRARGTARDVVRHPWLVSPASTYPCAQSEAGDQCVPDVLRQNA